MSDPTFTIIPGGDLDAAAATVPASDVPREPLLHEGDEPRLG
eukprot:COSAG01_NODE_15780_length_1300_cov_2.202331_1_plen_42_part_00